MRILHVIGGYLPHDTGGTQMVVRDLCRAQRAWGDRVEVFTRLAGRTHREFELSRSVWEDVPVTSITNNFDDVDRFELLYSHPAIDQRFDEVLQRIRPDVLHIHHLSCLSTSMIDVAARRRVPVVFGLNDYWMMCLRGQRIRPDDLGICETIDRDRCVACLHALWPHLLPVDGPRSLLQRLLGGATPAASALHQWEQHVRRVLKACQAVTAPSAFHRQRFVDWGLDPRRLFVAPPGVPRMPAPRPRAARPSRHVGFIGSVIPSKGVHVLCEAFDRLNRGDLVLDVYGDVPSFHGDTTYLSRLRGMIRPGLEARFHGRYDQDDLPDILSGLDVLVAPAIWWESYCLTVREGALAGLPVITTRLGGIADAVDRGLATACRPGDPVDLARAIEAALSQPPSDVVRARAEACVPTPEASSARMSAIYALAAGQAQPDSVPLEYAHG